MTRTNAALVAALAAALIGASPARSAEIYPSRPVALIVPYAPGGAADIIARPLSLALQRSLKQPFLVSNRPGAAGAIGNQLVANAKPDGYTLLVTVVQISILPEVAALFGRAPPYQLDQFAPIARLTADPVIILVQTNASWKTLADLIDDARAHPHAIPYSTGGSYSGIHLPIEMLSQAAGIELLHIPYGGGGPSMAALLGGEVQATGQVPGVAAAQIAGGLVRALAQSGGRRLTELPDIPTFRELGYDIEFYLWAGFFAPKGTPPEILATLDRATRSAMDDADLKAQVAGERSELAYQDALAFGRWWSHDAANLIEVVRRIGKVE